MIIKIGDIEIHLGCLIGMLTCMLVSIVCGFGLVIFIIKHPEHLEYLLGGVLFLILGGSLSFGFFLLIASVFFKIEEILTKRKESDK
mgnify:CR=1 FL=1